MNVNLGVVRVTMGGEQWRCKSATVVVPIGAANRRRLNFSTEFGRELSGGKKRGALKSQQRLLR